jgi:predicted DNA-binding protein (MmcQ/YjbR family)
MGIENYYNYCLSKKGVTEHFPFDDDILVFKLGEKIFALSSLSQWENGRPSINLKCDPQLAIALRIEHYAIQPGFHMNKKHWNTIAVNESASDELIKQLIDHSYELIFNSLKKILQQEIIELEN